MNIDDCDLVMPLTHDDLLTGESWSEPLTREQLEERIQEFKKRKVFKKAKKKGGYNKMP